MKQETLDRRLELLVLEGQGFSKPEIVKEISERRRCSTRLVYWDFQTKPRWQVQIQQLKQAALKAINRHDQLYRKASFQYMQVSKDNPRLSLIAIKEMRELNRDFFDMLQEAGISKKIAEKIIHEIVFVNDPKNAT